eukprot:m51a1_g14690 hypothetical protein (644) ;mRNA; f:100527-103031
MEKKERDDLWEAIHSCESSEWFFETEDSDPGDVLIKPLASFGNARDLLAQMQSAFDAALRDEAQGAPKWCAAQECKATLDEYLKKHPIGGAALPPPAPQQSAAPPQPQPQPQPPQPAVQAAAPKGHKRRAQDDGHAPRKRGRKTDAEIAQAAQQAGAVATMSATTPPPPPPQFAAPPIGVMQAQAQMVQQPAQIPLPLQPVQPVQLMQPMQAMQAMQQPMQPMQPMPPVQQQHAMQSPQMATLAASLPMANVAQLLTSNPAALAQLMQNVAAMSMAQPPEEQPKPTPACQVMELDAEISVLERELARIKCVRDQVRAGKTRLRDALDTLAPRSTNALFCQFADEVVKRVLGARPYSKDAPLPAVPQHKDHHQQQPQQQQQAAHTPCQVQLPLPQSPAVPRSVVMPVPAAMPVSPQPIQLPPQLQLPPQFAQPPAMGGAQAREHPNTPVAATASPMAPAASPGGRSPKEEPAEEPQPMFAPPPPQSSPALPPASKAPKEQAVPKRSHSRASRSTTPPPACALPPPLQQVPVAAPALHPAEIEDDGSGDPAQRERKAVKNCVSLMTPEQLERVVGIAGGSTVNRELDINLTQMAPDVFAKLREYAFSLRDAGELKPPVQAPATTDDDYVDEEDDDDDEPMDVDDK